MQFRTALRRRADTAATAPQLDRRERRAAGAVFIGVGVLAGAWSSRIPAVQQQAGVDAAQLGMALFGSGVGVLVGIALTAPVSRRLADRRWVVGSVTAYAAALVLVGLARSFTLLVLALASVGLASGLLTTVENLLGTGLERARGRPVMSLLFGLKSLGVLAGGATGALAAALGVSAGAHFALVIVSLAAAGSFAARGLAVHRPEPMLADPAAPAPVRSSRPWLLAVVAFVAVLGHGTTMDWSAVYISSDLGGAQALAAMAPTVFVATVCAGRLAGNLTAGRYGSTATLRACAALASVGMVVVGTAVGVKSGLVGLALAGAGLSCMTPLATAAAATVARSRPGTTMGLVTAVACSAYLVGPPFVGFVAARAGLAPVFLLLALLLMATGAAARPALGVHPREPS